MECYKAVRAVAVRELAYHSVVVLVNGPAYVKEGRCRALCASEDLLYRRDLWK